MKTQQELFRLIDFDMDSAFTELDKLFLHKNPTYMDLLNEFVDRPNNFAMTTFRAKMKNFVRLNYVESSQDTSQTAKKASNNPSSLKILMMTANPTGTAKLNLDKEHSAITQKIENHAEKFQLLLRKAVSSDEFKEFSEQLKPNLLHFSGHGEKGNKSGIYVQNDDKNGDELIPLSGLEALFEYLKGENVPLKVVLLNACYSEEQAQAIAKYVPYVMGTTVALGDKLAIAFSTGFYFKLAETNFNFETAFKSGRTQAVMAGALKSYFVSYKDGQKLEL